jgi:hypothetical protein
MKIVVTIFVMALAAAPVCAASPFDKGPVADKTLGAVTGKGDDTQTVLATNTASVVGNHVVGNSTTGVITIDGNAFQSLNGLAIINANTGNNVAINASLNVNVTIHP